MISLVMVIQAIICILLCVSILMQAGKGGGLTEGFASAESMFGAKTNEFMIKTTTVLACLFLVSCLSLAFLSSQKDKSLMSRKTFSKDNVERVGIPLNDTTVNATIPPTP